jgi:phosphate transport system substrate-binding protein
MVGSYPLARFFYLYLNRKPGAPPDVVSEFAKYALSKAGQQIVIKDGYIPLDAATAATQRAALE